MGSSSVQLIDTSSWQVIRTFEGHILAVTSVAFPDGKQLRGRDDQALGCGHKTRVLKGHTRGVTSVAFSDGSSSPPDWDGTNKLWDISDLLGR